MVNNEFGIIGSGVSGSGKSTFAKKLELEGFTILHDEITLIRKINSRFYIYPTPFNYNPKHIVNFSPAKELKYLFFLKQEQNYYTKDINLKDFNKKILKVIFSNTKLRIKYFDIILDLINAIYFSKIIKKEISFNLSESLINHIL
jgi:hypothetical protein